MHERRRKARRLQREEDPGSGRMPQAAAIARHVVPALPTNINYDTASIPSASTGYKALPDSKDRVYALDELVGQLGFALIKAGRGARPIVDKNGLVVAAVVSPPRDPGWAEVHKEAHHMLLASAERCKFPKNSTSHRRGNFAALNAGISFGGGQKVPGNLVHCRANANELEALINSKPFVRIAGLASSAFATWAPKLHAYYNRNLTNILNHHPNLRRNFANSVWAAAAFNFGPQTVTARHRDFANLPFGWCGVTALGDYDYVLGGHIVLWEAKLVIEFPPGYTVLLPSAAVAHQNTPIRGGETRTSFTQYSAGGIFRWAEHGFQLEKDYCRGMSKNEQAEMAAENLARTKMGLSLFSKLDDLCCADAAHISL